jgi:uncharacterized protein involved in exopolysaccharide biosynthesis
MRESKNDAIRFPEERSILEGILQLLAVLRRYARFIVLFTVVAAAGLLVYLFISLTLPPDRSPLPNRYRAYAVILLEQEGGDVSELLASISPSQPGPIGGVNYGQVALQALGSRSFLDTVADEFKLVEKLDLAGSSRIRTQLRDYIRAHADFTFNRNTGELVIGFEETDPVFARDVVNRMVELLDQWFSLKSGTQRLRMKNLLEQKMAEVSITIDDLEKKIKDFQQKYSVLSVQELSSSQTSLLANLRSQLIMTELEIKNHARFSKIEDPILTRLKTERDNALEMISQIENGSGGSGRVLPGQKDLPELALQFSKMSTELNIQRRIYETLSGQYEVAKLSLEGSPVFQILELAEIPEVKSGPKRSQIATIGVFLAFAASVLLSFLHHTFIRIRNDPRKMRILQGDTP